MTDVLRVESAAAEMAARLAQVEALLERKEREELPKGLFYGLFFAMCGINHPTKGQHFRSWCNTAWHHYQAALRNDPTPSVEEMYGSPASPAPIALPRDASKDAPGRTITSESYVPPVTTAI
jgi:hypothetical protein